MTYRMEVEHSYYTVEMGQFQINFHSTLSSNLSERPNSLNSIIIKWKWDFEITAISLDIHLMPQSKLAVSFL